MSAPSLGDKGRNALRVVLQFASANSYTTAGVAWRQLIASLAFETRADLSLIRDFDEQDQARFLAIAVAFMTREVEPDEVRCVYLEFFPRPQFEAGGWLHDV